MDFESEPALDAETLAFDIDQFEIDNAAKLSGDTTAQAYCGHFNTQKDAIGTGYETDGTCQQMMLGIKVCKAKWDREDGHEAWKIANPVAYQKMLDDNAATNAVGAAGVRKTTE